MEGVVHEGWLVKSPPEKRLLKAKWRQRWFVLRHSGLLPGQYILEYFTDNSCKKLKGKIDLDHCDQIDVGSTCETKKTSYQYMFDIITPKRTYYLVAETEAEMNKWVECICTVGGLKLYVDEDYLTPQDSSPCPSMTPVPVTTNLLETKSTSNPYIPISECHTGKPVVNGDLPKTGKLTDLPKEAPPPPPITNVDPSFPEALSLEFYDHPRPIKPTTRSAGGSKFGTVHRSSNLSESVADNFYDGFRTLPPQVNWNTHPGEVHSPDGSAAKRESLEKAILNYDVVPPLHSVKQESLLCELQSLASDLGKASIEPSLESSSLSGSTASLPRAPPRPPKPSKLRDRHDYENFELIQTGGSRDDEIYDIPPTPVKTTDSSVTVPAAEHKKNFADISVSCKAPVSGSSGIDWLDDTYDFPKSRADGNINASVPPPSSCNSNSTHRSKRHIYSNAPPGLFNSKDMIFNYEYLPSLMSDYANLDASKQDSYSNNTSPGVKGTYANIPNTSPSVSGSASDTPPAVNRDLKPKGTVDDAAISFLTLQPPPLYKMRANKCSFRRHGDMYKGCAPSPIPGLNGTPPVPNRFRHHPERSGVSEDDVSSFSGSRRGSTNDDQARNYFCGKKSPIQYLDLDLDSEPSPSPKSPERISATVYKKVDFVKTKAFNEMRQNVEETYRKSQ